MYIVHGIRGLIEASSLRAEQRPHFSGLEAFDLLQFHQLLLHRRDAIEIVQLQARPHTVHEESASKILPPVWASTKSSPCTSHGTPSHNSQLTKYPIHLLRNLNLHNYITATIDYQSNYKTRIRVMPIGWSLENSRNSIEWRTQTH